MSSYVITYDLRAPGRNYSSLYRLLGEAWGAAKVAESVWLANLNGTAGAVRDTIRGHLDANDRIVVIELKAGSGWGTVNGMPAGVQWLSDNITTSEKVA